jgi:hypothetical protein
LYQEIKTDMDKIHKYAQRYCDEVKISDQGNSYYYHFNNGKLILRISDHIGRNSDGKVSIIIDENGYLLHNHNTGAVYVETYENLKDFIKSLSILSNVNVKFDMSLSENSNLRQEVNILKQQLDSAIKKNQKLGDNNTRINNENVKYKNQNMALKKENESLREEMRCHPFRTWFKLFTRYKKKKK